MRGRSNSRKFASHLNRLSAVFRGVAVDTTNSFLKHRLVSNPFELPATRPSYPAALCVAKVIIESGGVLFRSSAGHLSLPPLLINMESVFEDYLRAVLAEAPLVVLDGNKSPPLGGSKPLFESTSDGKPGAAEKATPDIVCYRELLSARPALIIDAKYKLIGKTSDRSDVNQVLAYALCYGCPQVMLVYPRRSASSERGLSSLGKAGAVEAFMYRFDLGASDLTAEETLFREEVRRMCLAVREDQ